MVIPEIDRFMLDDYKTNRVIYKGYEVRLKDLDNKRSELEEKLESWTLFLSYLISALFVFGVLSIFNQDIPTNLLLSIFLSIYLFGFINLLLENFLINALGSESLSIIKNEIESIEKLKIVVKNKIATFEDIIINSFQKQLDNFFSHNLYKKRSGAGQFSNSLSDFESMINEVDSINRQLTIKSFNLGEYKDYLQKRKANHEFQSLVRSYPVTQADELIKTLEEPIISKPVEVLPPEKLYKTAVRIVDWDKISRRRRLTGLIGEEVAVVIEQEYLESINKKELADKVRHASKDLGDGLGYDILSFFANGKEKYIEVKSTTNSLKSPFFMSRNELSFLNQHTDDYFIYRILISETEGKEPVIEAYSADDILKMYDLIPTQYVVQIK